MKIAIPTRGNQIDSHFGHCEYFTIFSIDMDKKEITAAENIKAPEGCGCKSNIAQILSENGVKLMIAGNMGDGAVKVLHNSGIDVIRGCSGDVKSAAYKWLEGELEDSGDSCHENEHGCHNQN